MNTNRKQSRTKAMLLAGKRTIGYKEAEGVLSVIIVWGWNEDLKIRRGQ